MISRLLDWLDHWWTPAFFLAAVLTFTLFFIFSVLRSDGSEAKAADCLPNQVEVCGSCYRIVQLGAR